LPLALLVLLTLGGVKQTPRDQRAGCDTVMSSLLSTVASYAPEFEAIIPANGGAHRLVVTLRDDQFVSSDSSWIAFVRNELGVASGLSAHRILVERVRSRCADFRRVGFVLVCQVHFQQ
jgi:hypothetical protein